MTADLSIARGLDYYTGTVFETRLDGYESMGSICSGGRYDALASDGRTTYPGVGISLGVSRVVVPLLARTGLTASRSVPSAVLVAVVDEDSRATSSAVAADLRRRDVPCEVAPDAAKFGKQIRYAERRGIPFVWFVQPDGTHQVKDIRSGEQVDADPATWAPPEADLRPSISTPHHHDKHRGDPVIRTHDAGALRAEHVGQTVTLAGWVARRRDHGGVAFLDLREASGVVQVVVRDEAVAHSLRSEYCLKVTGEVVARKAGNENPNLATGEIEVVALPGAEGIEVLSASDPLPFPIDDASGHKGGEVGEEARLKHRYLDLRRSRPQRGPAPALQGQQGGPRRPRRPRLRRGRDAHPHPLDARGRPRLPGPRAAGARQLVRPAAEPAAVQAAAHGRRHGALLPDRALLPRRGLPRRPPARVHPARHRDELRRPGGRHHADGGRPRGHVGAGRPRPSSGRCRG